MTWRMKMHDAPIKWDDAVPEAWPDGKRHVVTFHGDFVARERNDGRVSIHRASIDGVGELFAIIEASALGGYSFEEEGEALHLHEHSAQDKRLGLRDTRNKSGHGMPKAHDAPGTHADRTPQQMQTGLRALNERNRRFWEVQ